jgi:hypothetical protein
VNDATRPKDEDYAQACAGIDQRAHMLNRQERASLVCQEKECDSLDNADQRQLDVDNDGIELAAAFAWRIHDATRKRSMIKLSRR